MSLLVIRLPDVDTLADGLRMLRERAGDAAGVQLEVTIRQAVDPLAWLAAQPAGQRLYWADRGGSEVAGWGFADVQERLPDGSDGRYFGGMAFDPNAPTDPAWAPLGRCRFFLPRLRLETTDSGQTLTVDCRDGADLDGVNADCVSDTVETFPGEIVEHSPDFDGWSEGIAAATAALEQGVMRKVVLARQTTVDLHAPVDPFVLLARLRQPGGFVFGFEVADGHAFVGCSPERLFRRAGRALSTEALAGTRPRGNTRQQDHLLAAKLLASAKERAEHHHVVEAIEADLAPLCTALSRDARPGIRRLSRVQHLHTPFSGHLASTVTDGDLLTAMHPTPAVCGRPTDRARDFIGQTEPFDRGWYAGPVGWVDHEAAEFAVGIRSVLLVDGQLRFCTGAGIVAGSQADSEWAELGAKSSRLTSLLEAPQQKQRSSQMRAVGS
ncbi:MAG: menaquinone-specific isochorismate synthase [Myxococcota bacterium]